MNLNNRWFCLILKYLFLHYYLIIMFFFKGFANFFYFYFLIVQQVFGQSKNLDIEISKK